MKNKIFTIILCGATLVIALVGLSTEKVYAWDPYGGSVTGEFIEPSAPYHVQLRCTRYVYHNTSTVYTTTDDHQLPSYHDSSRSTEVWYTTITQCNACYVITTICMPSGGCL